jgi:RimJ/RimL family protein N-acetyltransferase/protein tyrosine phosphatase (PTP) superfamily phosphohydrolase (DUF442 family)
MINDIYNFKAISSMLATSGQPSESELLEISKEGYEIVINLGLDGAEYSVKNEKIFLESHGIKYVHIPITFDNPEINKFETFHQYLKSNFEKKIFIHCAANKRVSVFIALFRIIEQGWNYEDAYNEILAIWEPNETWLDFLKNALISSKNGKIEIVDFSKSDLNLMIKWRSDNHINRFLRQSMRTLPEIQKWYDEYFSLEENKLYSINMNDSPIGYFTIEHIDMKNKNCEFGIVVGEKSLHGKGIGASALKIMLERAFTQLGMHRVYAIIQDCNLASEKCFLKAGFILEGRQRESRFTDNAFRDILIYSILEHEWKI